jgi:hypothetical protein
VAYPHSCGRRSRVTILEKEALDQDTEEALKKKEMEADARRKQSHDLVAESIKRELAESTSHFIVLYYFFLIVTRRGEGGHHTRCR